MDAIQLLQINLHVAHDAFNGTVADLTQEMMDWVPPGVALPIGERYAHAVAAEDWLVNGISKGGAPLFTTTWANIFTSGPLRLNTAEARMFRVELPKLREYARAIFPATEAYLNSLDASEDERVYDMSVIGIPTVPAPAWWSTCIIHHLHDVMGEISALKGCLGAKGYPF